MFVRESLPARATRAMAARLRGCPPWIRRSYGVLVIGAIMLAPVLVLAGVGLGALIGDPSGRIEELEIIAPRLGNPLVCAVVIAGVLASVVSRLCLSLQCDEDVRSKPAPTQARSEAFWQRSQERSRRAYRSVRARAMRIPRPTKEASAHGASFQVVRS